MYSIKPIAFRLLAIILSASALTLTADAMASDSSSIAINGNADAKDYPVMNPSRSDHAINMDGGDEEARELYGYQPQGLKDEAGAAASNSRASEAKTSQAKASDQSLAETDRHIRHQLAALKLELDILKKELKAIEEIRSDIAGLKKVALMHAQGIDDNSRDIDYQLRTLKNLGTDVAASKTDFDEISKQIENRMERKTTELYDTNSLLNLKVEQSAGELRNLKTITYILVLVIVLLAFLLFVLFRLSRQVSKLKKHHDRKVKTVSFSSHAEKQRTDENKAGDDTVKEDDSSFGPESGEKEEKSLKEEAFEKANQKMKAQAEKKKKEEKKQSPKPFHSLVLRISDDIAKMETQLFTLDKESEDYKELTHAIERKKKIAADNGYTISGYSGLEYRIDMPYEAEFIKDTSLEEGKAVVCGMLKMQVEYKGQIVQQAKLLVRENC